MLGRTIREYRVLRRLGHGGMAHVWLAEHMTSKTRVALKFLASELQQFTGLQARFVSEARSLSRLDHPNIVGIRDFFLWQGEFCLVLEFVDGHSLRTLLARDGPMPSDRVLRLSLQVLAALKYAHALGIIHRDVNSRNIMVSKTQRAKIMDFGIALDREMRAKERQGMLWGTPAFMSPERIQNPGRMDVRSDIYSFGVVMFHMLTGELPFDGENPSQMWQQHLTAEVPDLRRINESVDPRFSPIVRRALEKRPRDRFRDCAEMCRHVGALAKDIGLDGPEIDGTTGKHHRSWWRNAWRWVRRA